MTTLTEQPAHLAPIDDAVERQAMRVHAAVLPILTSAATDRLARVYGWLVDHHRVNGNIAADTMAQALAGIGGWAEHLEAGDIRQEPHGDGAVMVFCQVTLLGADVRVWALIYPSDQTPEV